MSSPWIRIEFIHFSKFSTIKATNFGRESFNSEKIDFQEPTLKMWMRRDDLDLFSKIRLFNRTA